MAITRWLNRKETLGTNKGCTRGEQLLIIQFNDCINLYGTCINQVLTLRTCIHDASQHVLGGINSVYKANRRQRLPSDT